MFTIGNVARVSTLPVDKLLDFNKTASTQLDLLTKDPRTAIKNIRRAKKDLIVNYKEQIDLYSSDLPDNSWEYLLLKCLTGDMTGLSAITTLTKPGKVFGFESDVEPCYICAPEKWAQEFLGADVDKLNRIAATINGSGYMSDSAFSLFDELRTLEWRVEEASIERTGMGKDLLFMFAGSRTPMSVPVATENMLKSLGKILYSAFSTVADKTSKQAYNGGFWPAFVSALSDFDGFEKVPRKTITMSYDIMFEEGNPNRPKIIDVGSTAIGYNIDLYGLDSAPNMSALIDSLKGKNIAVCIPNKEADLGFSNYEAACLFEKLRATGIDVKQELVEQDKAQISTDGEILPDPIFRDIVENPVTRYAVLTSPVVKNELQQLNIGVPEQSILRKMPCKLDKTLGKLPERLDDMLDLSTCSKDGFVVLKPLYDRKSGKKFSRPMVIPQGFINTLVKAREYQEYVVSKFVPSYVDFNFTIPDLNWSDPGKRLFELRSYIGVLE